MKPKIIFLVLAVLILAGATTASILHFFPYNPSQPPPADQGGVTEEGIHSVVDANNAFAFDLYSQLKKDESGNIFYSPYSISAALAMTWEGANGKTADEIKSVFHFPVADILRSDFAAIYNDINTQNDQYQLKTGNALWVQKDFPFLPDYISRVERYYGGKAQNVDFVNETEQTRQTINSFIAEQTNDKIKDLIAPGQLDSMTRLVLTNAIYFKGDWKWQFDSTSDDNFWITPKNSVKVPLMDLNPGENRLNYAKVDGLQILELPYKGDRISMLILLPDGDLGSVESKLTVQKLNEYKGQMELTGVNSIVLPKFELNTRYSLENTLADMGMPTAFTSAADFSGMDGAKDLLISFVVHQAFIKVDEQGTEAAAATGVGMALTAINPAQQINFRADHPFIFLIQDKESGNILFLGRVINPAE